MKLQDYKKEDVAEMMELKKLVLHQNEKIEMNLWSDSIDEAIARTLNQYQTLQKLRVMKSAKEYEEKLQSLCNELKRKGVTFQTIPYCRHKKTD